MNPYTQVIGWDRGRLARIQDTLMSIPDACVFPIRCGRDARGPGEEVDAVI